VLYSESKFYSYLETLAFFRVPVRVAPPPSLRVRPAVVDVRKALQALLPPHRILPDRAPLLLLLRRGRHVRLPVRRLRDAAAAPVGPAPRPARPGPASGPVGREISPTGGPRPAPRPAASAGRHVGRGPFNLQCKTLASSCGATCSSAPIGHLGVPFRRRTAALATPLQSRNTWLQRRALPGSKKHHALAGPRTPRRRARLRAT